MTTHRIALFSVAFSLVLAACGDGVSTLPTVVGNEVSGSLREWAVQVDRESASVGEVTFSITNEGSIEHEFLVVKTEFADGKIPLTGEQFLEEAPGIDVIDEIAEFPAGETASLTVSLEGGSYQLVCNLPGHYKAGMHTPFTVIE